MNRELRLYKHIIQIQALRSKILSAFFSLRLIDRIFAFCFLSFQSGVNPVALSFVSIVDEGSKEMSLAMF